MKKLFLIRHAKSDWSEPGLRDHDRKLNDRGRRDAPLMAKRFVEEHGNMYGIITSTAVRARSTAETFAKAMHVPEEMIREEARIYEAEWRQLLDVVNNLPGDLDSVVIFGHNPGISDLVAYLTGVSLHMPTCAIVELNPMTEDWKSVSACTCNLSSFDYPKKSIG